MEQLFSLRDLFNPDWSIAHERFQYEVANVITSLETHGQAARPFPRSIWLDIGRAGILRAISACTLEEKPLGLLGVMILADEAAKHRLGGLLLALVVQSYVAAQWLSKSTNSRCTSLLPSLLSGDLLFSHCDTDAQRALPATAVRIGDHIVINGTKVFSINAPIADMYLVTANCGGRSVTMVVPASAPGVRRGDVHLKLGTNSVASGSVHFDNVRIPEEFLLSSDGPAPQITSGYLMSSLRLCIAVGACRMHHSLIAWSQDYGRNRTIAHIPLLEWPSNLHPWIDAHIAGRLMKAGLRKTFYSRQSASAFFSHAASIKWYSVEKSCDWGAQCCDLAGGQGYMLSSLPLEIYRELRGFRMAGGSQTSMLTIKNHRAAFSHLMRTFAHS